MSAPLNFLIYDQGMWTMKYLTASALALSVLSFNASAELLVGGNLFTSISGDAKAEFDVLDDEITENTDVSGLSVFIGSKNERNNRFLLSLESTTVDFDKSNDSEDLTGLNFDWQFVYTDEQIKPYWAIGFGVYKVDEALVLTGTDKEGDSLSGFAFQLGAGAKIEVTPQFELDVSFKRQAIVWQDIELDVGFVTETISTTYVHNNVNVGAAFMF